MRGYRPSQYPDVPRWQEMDPETIKRRGDLIEIYAWRVAAGLPLFEPDMLGELGRNRIAQEAPAA